MSETVSSSTRATYREATEHLLAGRAREALSILATLPIAEMGPEHLLARGKAHLELNEGGEALAALQGVSRDEEGMGDAMRAYLRLLSAAAASLDGRPEESLRLLDEVARIDPRMEHAARALRERVHSKRSPIIRF